jgi:hypothetical protein
MLVDIFSPDAFNLLSMTQAVEKVPFLPQLLGDMNLFDPSPVRTEKVAVERRDGILQMIQTSPRGADSSKIDKIRPKLRDFRTSRIILDDTIYAHELQNMRAFGSESDVQTLTDEVTLRQKRISDRISLTLENMRLGAVQGVVTDADASTIYDFYAEFGISQPAEIGFTNANVTTAGGMVPFLDNNITRAMLRSLGGNVPGAQIVALVGDSFFDWFTQHPDVVKTYLNWMGAEALRDSNAFRVFNFAGIMWVNYRGTDDNSTVAITTNKAKFFAKNVPGLFQHVMSPGEQMALVNTLGRERYSWIVPDKDEDLWVKIKVASYPLMMCTRPESLLRGSYS